MTTHAVVGVGGGVDARDAKRPKLEGGGGGGGGGARADAAVAATWDPTAGAPGIAARRPSDDAKLERAARLYAPLPLCPRARASIPPPRRAAATASLPGSPIDDASRTRTTRARGVLSSYAIPASVDAAASNPRGAHTDDEDESDVVARGRACASALHAMPCVELARSTHAQLMTAARASCGGGGGDEVDGCVPLVRPLLLAHAAADATTLRDRAVDDRRTQAKRREKEQKKAGGGAAAHRDGAQHGGRGGRGGAGRGRGGRGRGRRPQRERESGAGLYARAYGGRKRERLEPEPEPPAAAAEGEGEGEGGGVEEEEEEEEEEVEEENDVIDISDDGDDDDRENDPDASSDHGTVDISTDEDEDV